MTIRRIVKTTNRVVALAELQSSNYLSGHATVYRGSQLVARSRIIDHVAYNELSSAYAFFDFLLTTDAVTTLLVKIREFNDSIAANTQTKLSIVKRRTDNINSTDVIKLVTATRRLFQDAIASADSRRSLSVSKSRTDTLSLSDSRSVLLGMSRTDAVTNTDSLRSATNYVRNPANDTVSIAEILARAVAYSRKYYDTLSLQDQRAFAVTTLKTDTQTIADQRAFVVGRVLQDPAIYATDATRKLAGKGSFDTLTPADVKSFNFAKIRAEAVGIAEQRAFYFTKGLYPDVIMLDSKAFTISKVFADTTVMLDLTNVFDGITYSTVLNKVETLITADYAALSNSIVRGQRDGFKDTISFSDIISRILGKYIYLTDAATISDVKRLLIGKSLTDTATPTEALAKQIGKRASPDQTTPTDVRTFNIAKALADTEILTDTSKFNIGNLRTDAFSQADQVYQTMGNLRTDTFILSDLRSLVTGKGRSETIVGSDGMAKLPGKGLADSITLADLNISRSVILGKFDTANMSDVFARIYGRGLSLIDSIGNTDATLLIRGKLAADTIVMGSTLDQRQSNFERVSFAITRLFRDSTIMLDQAGVYDGQNNQVTIFKYDQFSIGADSNYNDNSPFIKNYQTVPVNFLGRTSIVYANSWILSSPNVDAALLYYGDYSSSISRIVRSTDNGASWSSITLNEAAGQVGYNVAVNDTGTVVLAIPKYSPASSAQPIWRSLDYGTTWQSSTTTIPAYQTTLAATIWANGYWFTFNAARSNQQSSNSYYYSVNNAVSWSSSVIDVPASSSTYWGVQSVAYGAGVLFAMHAGYSSSSGYTAAPKLIYLTADNMPNGSWADCTPANLYWRPLQVAYGAGKFAVLTYVYASSTAVTVGSDGYYVLTSPDLANWTASTRSLPNADGIVFANNKFWVVDYTGTNVYDSVNGQDWTAHNNVFVAGNLGSTLALSSSLLAIVDTHLPSGIRNDYYNDDQSVVGYPNTNSWFSIYDVAIGDRGYTLPSIRNHARETVVFRPGKSLRDSIVPTEQLIRSTGTGLRDSFYAADYIVRASNTKIRQSDSQIFADNLSRGFGKRLGIGIDTVSFSDYVDTFTAVGRSPIEILSVNDNLVYFLQQRLFEATPVLESRKFDITKPLAAETQNIGFGGSNSLGLKVSGSNLERTPFQFNLTTKQGVNNTVSGVTVAGAALGERLFVGQQSYLGNTLGFRSSGDGQERIQFQPVLNKFETVISGNNIDGRSTSYSLGGIGPSVPAERVSFNITKIATVGADPQLIGFGSSLSTGLRVSGSNLERTALNITLVAKQGANVTVSGVTVAAASTSDTLRIGRQPWAGNVLGFRSSGDSLENFSVNFIKSLEAGSNTGIVSFADTLRTSSLFVRGTAFTQEAQPLLDLKSLVISKIMRTDDGTSTSDTTITQDSMVKNSTKLNSDNSGDLDPFGNINTLDSHGILRMTNYADLAYFAEDYVGELRSFI